jgi:sn-glycerol 3-phosphate transport system ATP-binding protein
MVFQNYALYPHLSVEENIVFGLHVKKIPKAERKARCEETAKMLGLSEYLKENPVSFPAGSGNGSHLPALSSIRPFMKYLQKT